MMNYIIEKVRISNFLSFFGEHEVNFTPYTAVMCNFYEGKDDFFRAFEYVFGADLLDLRVERPLDLVHKVLREEFLINREIQTFVEITLSSVQEKNQIKFCRSVKTGMNNVRLEHKVSDLVTTSVIYEEKLSCLGIHIKRKNLIFYKTYFNNLIWGSSEDLEQTICTCLRESYLLEDWKRINKEVQYLTKLKSHTAVKNCNSIRKSHSVITKYTKKFEAFCSHMETTAKEIMLTFANDSSSESSTSLISSPEEEEETQKKIEEKRQIILSLETKITILTGNLDDLKLKEAVLTSHLHYGEIKLAAKPVNAIILQNRLSLMKKEMHDKENQISEIWKETQTVKSELEDLSQKISLALISLQDLQIRKYRQNRLTQYGRFYDYLQPSRYIHLLKQIIGNDIFYAHLCDSFEDALSYLRKVRDLKYEHREVFIAFENYSHKLKDIITASGERGVQINTLEELLIFLCKLKHYQLIDEVPVIIQRKFNFESNVPKDYTIYIQSNLHFASAGLISLRVDENDFYLDTEKEIIKNLVQFYSEEEMGYMKWNDLLHLKWETLADMNCLENDVLYLKQKWRKSTQQPHITKEQSPAMEIYDEYRNIFREHDVEREREREIQQEEQSFLSPQDSLSASTNEESITPIVEQLQDVINERNSTEKTLETFTNQLRLLNVTPICCFRLQNNFITCQNNLNKTRLFFEKEFKKLKKLMREDDLEDFLGSQEWRTTVINSLIQNFETITAKLKTSSVELQNIGAARKKKLYQLFDHCSRFLTRTFQQILDDSLPFVKLSFGPGEEKVHIMTCLGEEKINIVQIKHFNTLLKFISAITIFLEIAKFDKVPFMVIDDIEEYFPHPNDDLEAVLDSKTLEKILPEKENPRFHLLMRLGQFLRHYIKQNTPGRLIRNNGNCTDYTNGPMQIIYFTKEDFIHAAEHYVWIKNKILPDEYIAENCSSYSEIHEIKLN